jgi:copper chaperone NosL
MKKSSFLMIIGSLLLLGLFYYPLWNIQLGAPQYPDPLGMNIYIHGIEGQEEFDIQNIDGVNKYIGMKKIPKAEEMWEFNIFPKVILGMVILGVIIGLLGFFKIVNHKWFLGWFILMTILGILGMYDFNTWLLDYGTDLDPKAILKLTDLEGNPLSYKPPLFGTDKILNFTASSYPALGGYMMFSGMALTLLAFFIGRKECKKLNP